MSLLIGFVVLASANAGHDLRQREAYSTKVFLVSGGLLLAYSITVVLVNVFSPVDIYPYAFIPPTGVMRFWLLPVSLHTLHIVVFLACKQLHRLRNVSNVRDVKEVPYYKNKTAKNEDADTFDLDEEFDRPPSE
jgi:hypothetical protein